MSDVTHRMNSGAACDATANRQRPGSANEDIAHLNRGYVCLVDAGPAWRAAHEAGVDLGLVEDALRMSPEARLREQQRALNLVLDLTVNIQSKETMGRDQNVAALRQLRAIQERTARTSRKQT